MKTNDFDRQMELENEMIDRGRDRYFATVARMKERNAEANTSYGKLLLKRGIEPLAGRIDKFIRESKAGGAGRRHKAVTMLEGLDTQVVAFITLRKVLDTFSQAMPYQRVAVLTVGLGCKVIVLDHISIVVNPHLAGRSTDPQRFSDEDLLERELSYGRSGFRLQFMLDTRLSDAERYPLKLKDLIVMGTSTTDAPEKPIWASGIGNVINDLPCVGLNGDRYHSVAHIHGGWIPYTGSVMAIDPAGRGADETAVCVVKMLNGYLYLTALRAYSDGYGDSTLESIAKLAKQEKVNHVIIEANFGDGMFTKLIQPFFTRIHPVKVEEVKHSRQKEQRIIDTLEPVMNQHRLVVNREVIQWDYESTKKLPPEQAFKYQLFYQMSRITRDRGSLGKDDRLDVLAMAVGHWVEQMGVDADKKIVQRREGLLKEELRAFTSATGASIRLPAGSVVDPMKFEFVTLSTGAGRSGGLNYARR